MPNRSRPDFLLIICALAVLVWGAVLAAYCGLPPGSARAEAGEGTEFFQVLGLRLKITDVLLSAFTGLLALFTWQLVRTGEQQRGHNLTTERAYVKMSHHSPPGLTVEQGSDPLCWLTVEVKNWGNTPATVTDAVLGIKLLSNNEPMPETATYKHTLIENVHRLFLVKGEGANYHPLPFSVGAENMAAIRNEELKLWLFGYVDYIDAFSVRHRSGYSRVYLPRVGERGNNLVFAPGDVLNDDRPRVRGEGKDW